MSRWYSRPRPTLYHFRNYLTFSRNNRHSAAHFFPVRLNKNMTFWGYYINFYMFILLYDVLRVLHQFYRKSTIQNDTNNSKTNEQIQFFTKKNSRHFSKKSDIFRKSSIFSRKIHLSGAHFFFTNLTKYATIEYKYSRNAPFRMVRSILHLYPTIFDHCRDW